MAEMVVLAEMVVVVMVAMAEMVVMVMVVAPHH